MCIFQRLVCLVGLSVAYAAVIVPGATWTDTSGNIIQAHGGGFLKVCTSTWSLYLSPVLIKSPFWFKSKGWIHVLLVWRR